MAKQKKRKKSGTSLSQHKQYKTTLTPPLAGLPGIKSSSWMDNRLPEMLWAALLIAELPRHVALDTFRAVGNYVSQFADTEDSLHDVSHTGLSRAKPERLAQFIHTITVTEHHRKALAPLYLLSEIPYHEVVNHILETEEDSKKW